MADIRFDNGYFALLMFSVFIVVQMHDSVNYESNNKPLLEQNLISLMRQKFWLNRLLSALSFVSKFINYLSKKVPLPCFLTAPGISKTGRWFSSILHQRLFNKGRTARAVIVGFSGSSSALANEFKKNPLRGVSLMGFFDDRWPERLSGNKQYSPETLLGSIEATVDFVKTHNVQQIYIALPMSTQPRVQALLDNLRRDTTATIYFVPDLVSYDLIQANMRIINGIPIVAVCASPFVGINSTIKRLSDVILSLLILSLIAPFLLLIAIGVKLSSPGPILFKQRRYGLDGKEIVVYKFRSMTVMEDGEKINQATRSDPRITRFGGFLRKTSLDELPQFFNVLQGHMSIVGPRPHAISHNEIYRSLIKGYMIRHKAKPGITGWAQVNGLRGETDTVEKMQKRIDYDLDYLRNWSLFLDLFIIFKTIGVIIKDKNAY